MSKVCAAGIPTEPVCSPDSGGIVVDVPSGEHVPASPGDGTIHRDDPPPPPPPRGLSRRAFITVGVGLLGVGVGATGGVLVARREDDHFASTPYDVGPVSAVVDRIQTGGPLPLPPSGHRLHPDDGSPASPIDVVIWDPSHEYPDGTALEVYGPEGEGHPVVDAHTGLMALLTVAPGRCLVPMCSSSGFYEDPCHFGRWNAWGESLLEPHDGFARVPLTIENGRVMAHLGRLTGPIPGRPYGSPVFDSEPAGPYCIPH